MNKRRTLAIVFMIVAISAISSILLQGCGSGMTGSSTSGGSTIATIKGAV